MWLNYQDSFDRNNQFQSLIPLTISIGRPGRPKFEVTKEQIEYLLLLSFTCNEIAALLGISRTTLYRC
jgi:DNA invertase Pin-like site-specific DNA recombinase